MDPYLEIEQRTGFAVPALYRRMRAEGVCDYGASPQTHGSLRRSVLVKPPALLGALDFEWLSLERIAAWTPPDYWNTEHLFVPFGASGAGDNYAFYPAWAEGDAVPIVLALHDENRCECLAPHLGGFLYRKMLEALAFYGPREMAESYGFSSAEEHQARRADVDVLRPYLRPAWMADLDAIVAREPKEWIWELPRIKEKYLSRLDNREVEQRITRELGFSHLNARFEHMG